MVWRESNEVGDGFERGRSSKGREWRGEGQMK